MAESKPATEPVFFAFSKGSLVCKFFSVDSLDETHTSGLDHSFEHLELDQGESFRGTLFHMLNKGK